MPSKIHWSGKNNRSQHNLVGSTAAEDPASVPASAAGVDPPSAGAGAANAPSGSANPAPFSPSESFQPDTPNTGRGNHAQQPPAPPPHLVNTYGNTATSIPPQLQHSNSVSGVFDSHQQRDQQDFADQVTRSQSYRYTQPSPTTSAQLLLQHQHQQHQVQPPLGSASVEDLNSPAHPTISSPILGAPPRLPYGGQQQQQQQQLPPAQPPKPKQSTRKLIKNILNPRGQDFAPQAQRDQYGGAAGPARRNSKRVSLPTPYPPSIRTGVSQVSLDQQQQLEWQNQGPPTQPSPLQGVGDIRESYVTEDSDQELRLQNSQDNQHPTIRAVPPSDAESSPYSTEDTGYRQHRAQLSSHGQIASDLQQQQYNQAVFEASAQQQQQQQQQYHLPTQQQQVLYHGGNQQTFSGHLVANPQHQNPETVSQLSHESPTNDSDQPSTSSIPPPTTVQSGSAAVNYPAPPQDLPGPQNPLSTTQAQAPQPQNMAPPPGGPPPARRSQEADKMRDQVQPPPGPPPSYRQSQQQPNMNPLPQPPNAGQPNPNFRASNVPDRQQFEGQGEPQGRNSPQPQSSDRGTEDPEKAFKDLLTKYKNVKRLYFDGKKEIEQLNGQVEQLQNAIANQRMSQSRTSLDDSEYTTRFNRLNGAINNLSFNIRKDWVSLPAWLAPFVSADALKTGKQEMTAVGRAVITRWLVDEIFNRCFHPGLDPELSRQLKTIELNIRNFSYTMNRQEEFDALTHKVVSWRMATLEGLQDVLNSSESANHRNDFTRRATSNLTASLFQYLTDPPPAGVDGSASMIVELAVGIASNLPLESRDVAILYPLPEQTIQPELMEVEKTGLPALETRPADANDEGAADNGGGAPGAGGKEAPPNKDGSSGSGGGKDRRGDKRSGMLSVLGAAGSSGSGSGSGSAPSSRKGSIADGGMAHIAPSPPKDPGKVRFAGFMAVEVRGRQVLVKAPVWTLGWDSLYERELSNHADDPRDEGTVWFDDADAEAKMVAYLNEHYAAADVPGQLDPSAAAVLDLGCGNGSLLFALRDEGWRGRLLGVDYSERSVELARRVGLSRRSRGEEEEESGEGKEKKPKQKEIEREVEFKVWDVLNGPLSDVRAEPAANEENSDKQERGWDLVLDKGTFDAVSLSGERDGQGRRICEGYGERVLQLLRTGGIFLVTSCNWTEKELGDWFETKTQPTATGEKLRLAGRIEYPSFQFGGVQGQTISTLCFEKVAT
ncbi:S-adenosylmethionine-dependent methyltransferase-like protein [Corynascus similis CBS 632.67]